MATPSKDPAGRPAFRSRTVFAALLLGWCLLVGGGIGWLWNYAATPGAALEPPAHWPAESAVTRVAGKATLLMLAHPQCSCTAASIGELELLMARVHDLTSAHVLFVRPESAPGGWDESSLFRRAERIPGVTTSWDSDGIEARRFGALTSGQTVVYDATGELIFHGGITVARGHMGDNAGRTSIVALLTRGEAARHESSVYGCSLEEHAEQR
jgi:hypothetical protein